MILEEFSEQIEQAIDLTPEKERAIRREFAKHHMVVEHMLILGYDNNQKEAFLTVRTNHGRCIMAKEAAQVLGQAMGRERWTVARNSKSIVTRQASTIRFLEEHGVAPIDWQIEDV